MRALVARISSLTGARLMGSVATFALTILIAREFGTQALAQFAIFVAAGNLISVLLPFGHQSRAIIDIPKLAVESRIAGVRQFLFEGYRTIAMNGAILMILAGAAWAFADWSGIETGSYLPVSLGVLAIAPVMALNHLHGGVLVGLQRPYIGQLPDGLFRPVIVLMMLGLLVAYGSDRSFWWVLICVGAGAVLTALVQAKALWPYISAKAVALECDEASGGGKRPNNAAWLGVTLCWDYHIDLLLLSAAFYASAEEIALLHVCFRIRALAGFAIRSAYLVIQPRIVEHRAAADLQAMANEIQNLNRLVALYCVAIIAILWFLAGHVLSVFDPVFAQYGSVLLIICAAIPLRALFGPSITLLASDGRQDLIFTILAGGVLASLVLSALLHPVAGVAAVASAYAGCVFASAVLAWAYAKVKCGTDTAIWAGHTVRPAVSGTSA